MKNKRILIVIASFTIPLLIVGSYYVYSFFTLSKDEAKNTVIHFFQMAKMNNVESHIYPSYSKIKDVISLKKDVEIVSVNENSYPGNYDVSVNYIHDPNYKIPIIFNVEKKKGKVYIKSSRGLSYHLYNGVFNFGVALKMLKGNETDSEIQSSVKNSSIDYMYLNAVDAEFIFARLGIEAIVNISPSYDGSMSGDVVLANSNDFHLANDELNCELELYDYEGQWIGVRYIKFPFGVNANKAVTSSPFFMANVPENFAKYKCNIDINRTERLKKVIEENILSKIHRGVLTKGEGKEIIFSGGSEGKGIIFR